MTTTVTEIKRVTADDFYDIPHLDEPSIDGQPDEYEDSWKPINLALLDDQPPLQPTLGQLGIVYPGKRHVFSGPQESAKTLAAYAIAIQVIRLGGSVIVIDFEMGQWDARNRLRELGATPQEIAQVHYIEPHEPATLERIETLVQLNPELVVIDAAAGAFDLQGLDDNKRQDVERFTRLYVAQFWRNGIATIVLDHVVKNVEGRGKYAIGSERKVGGADVHLGYEVITPIKRGGTGLYKIVTHKDRGGFLQRGKLAELELNSHPDTHQIEWSFKPAEHTDDTETFRPTHLMEKVSKYLEGQLSPVPRSDVLESLPHRAEHLRTAIRVLLSESFVAETPGEKNAKLLSSSRPYREDDPQNNPVRPGSPSVSLCVPDNQEEWSSRVSPPSRGTQEDHDPEDTPKQGLLVPSQDDDENTPGSWDDDIPF